MRYLKIENKAKHIPSFELFRLLGASSSRGDIDKIGQFGTGFPFTLAVLAREGMLENFKVCLGTSVHTFSTIDHKVKDSTGHTSIKKEICVKKQNGATVNMGISTGFGEVEWHYLWMGLRELISNAIDGAYSYDGTIDTVVIEQVEENQARAKDDYIRVFIPLTDEVIEYIDELETNFICLKVGYDNDRVILNKKNRGDAIIYRKGVKVGSFYESLFNYNLNEIELKESRVVDSSNAKDQAANALIKHGTIKQLELFFSEAIMKESDLWEATFDYYEVHPKYMHGISDQAKENVYAAIRNVVGDGVLCTDPISAHMIGEKGYRPVTLQKTAYNALFQDAGVKKATDILLPYEAEGKTIVNPTAEVVDAVDVVWSYIDSVNMTNGKDKPQVKCFNAALNGGSKTNGYYRPGGDTIYIHQDLSHDRGVGIYSVVLEEIGHYVTGANDCTRDFQDYFIRMMATKIMTDRPH